MLSSRRTSGNLELKQEAARNEMLASQHSGRVVKPLAWAFKSDLSLCTINVKSRLPVVGGCGKIFKTFVKTDFYYGSPNKHPVLSAGKYLAFKQQGVNRKVV